MNKGKAKFFRCLALLFGAVLLFLAWEHFSGELALNSRLKKLVAKGEKLELAELLPSKTPPKQNAALDLIGLTNDLHGFFALSKEAPPMMKWVGPGRAISSWQRDTWEVDKKKTNSWAAFGPKIEAAELTLDRLRSISSKTAFDDGFDYSKGFVDFQFPTLMLSTKQAALLLAEAVANDLRRTNLEAAKEHLHSLLWLVKSLENQRLVIWQLIRIACERMAIGATWEALQAPGWNDAQLAELQAALGTNEFPMAMIKSFELERAMTLDFYRQTRESRAKALRVIEQREKTEDMIGSSFGSLPSHGMILRYLHLPLWQVAWGAQDELRDLNRWRPIIEQGRMAVAKSWLEAKDLFPDSLPLSEGYLPIVDPPKEVLGMYDRCRYLFSEQYFSLNGMYVLKPLKAETEKNLAIAAIALKRYQLRRGKPASELSELVPEFLAAVPIDRMDGKPLRYHQNTDGSFKLYSVGLNGIDEGGDSQPLNPGEEFHDIWKEKDAVWPDAVADAGETVKATGNQK